MEKTIQLDQRELQTVATIDQEFTQAQAQWAILRRQLDQADKLCEQAAGKRDSFVQQAAAARGVPQIMRWRPEAPGVIIVTFPDMPESAAVPPGSAKANGAPAVIDVT